MSDVRRPNETSKPASPNHRAALSRATRRNVRQAIALATELNLHSVAVAGYVWTLRHDLQHGRDLPGSMQKQQGNVDVKSKRQQRSETRLLAYRALQARARAHIARRTLRIWRNAAAAAGKQQQQKAAAAATVAAVDNAVSAAAAAAAPPPQQQPQPQPPGVLQQREAMDDERAPKRTPASPLAGDSPSEPRAKRTLALPPGRPPPSAPPSPPSPSPSPPPSARRESLRKEVGVHGSSVAEYESDPESVSDDNEFCIECHDEGVSVPACGVMHFGPNIVPLCQSHAEELSFFMRSYE
jgi:hypothetical protein